jgi:Nucleotide modification associated domain 3
VKVIFSRKGVDSAAGKLASALVDRRPYSLPIPEGPEGPTRFAGLSEPWVSLARDLSNGRLANDQRCHLDPDIDEMSLAERLPGWRGSLGQAGPALSHLRNQGVGVGDLFLFWGLYRSVRWHNERWHYDGPRRHCLFGWLMVGEVLDLGADGSRVLATHPWLAEHPHARAGRNRLNAIYTAASSCEFGGKRFAGSGVFRNAVMLSAEDSRLPSEWCVPIWLNPNKDGTGITYHSPERFAGTRLRSAARGQEFVADIGDRADAKNWIVQTLESGL